MASNKSAERSPPDREKAEDQPPWSPDWAAGRSSGSAPSSYPEVPVDEVDVLSESSSASAGGGEEHKAKGKVQDRQGGVQCKLLRAQPNAHAGPHPTLCEERRNTSGRRGGQARSGIGDVVPKGGDESVEDVDVLQELSGDFLMPKPWGGSVRHSSEE